MAVSLNPKDFQEGGAVPAGILRWAKVGTGLFDYTKKDGTVVTAGVPCMLVTYVDEAGAEHVQNYSAGDAKRLAPSMDGETVSEELDSKGYPVGKTFVALIEGAGITRTSNAGILLAAIISAGFPENRLPADGDMSAFEGMLTENALQKPPSRGSDITSRDISVPIRIIELPWEAKKAPAAAGSKAAAKKDADPAEKIEAVIEQINKMLTDDVTSVTRQQVATALIKAKKQAAAQIMFAEGTDDALAEAGIVVDGDTLSKLPF